MTGNFPRSARFIFLLAARQFPPAMKHKTASKITNIQIYTMSEERFVQSMPYRSEIPPVPDGAPRPFWSVMIPTYHCARFLGKTLESVLTQDPGPEMMQIEVVDDGSTLDDPERVVEEIGQGRVAFYRQPQNVGHTKNFETCLKRARGQVVHLLHGDDYVLPGFYQKLQVAFEAQ